MDQEQMLELQRTVEEQAYEIQRLSDGLRALRLRNKEEDVRKRLFRLTAITCDAVIIIMLWWGISEISTHVNALGQCVLR